MKRRRPQEHLRTTKDKVVPVNPGISYDQPQQALRAPSGGIKGTLAALTEPDNEYPFFDPQLPLDRQLVAATYGKEWKDAKLYTTEVTFGFSGTQWGEPLRPRNVNYLALPTVDPSEALQRYFAEEAQRNPTYRWGNPDVWAQEFSLESIILFDDDSAHYAAQITSPERLKEHGLLVLDTKEAEWNPSYHEYSKEKRSLSPHIEATKMATPTDPYTAPSYSEALEAITSKGERDPAEFSVLLWVGEVELRENGTYATTSDGYDPENNHIPPWVISGSDT